MPYIEDVFLRAPYWDPMIMLLKYVKVPMCAVPAYVTFVGSASQWAQVPSYTQISVHR